MPTFEESAEFLDFRRLGKQRVECYQLLRTLAGETSGWKNHPCTRMWKDYQDALVIYGLAMCIEWISRGYNDTLHNKILSYQTIPRRENVQMPPWLGWEEFHASHRANLLRKDPIWYGNFGWTDCPLLPYVWP